MSPPDRTRKGQHHARLAKVVGAAFVIGLPIALFPIFGDLMREASQIFNGPKNGVWQLEQISSRPADRRYTVEIRYGAIEGGYDGCNNWDFMDERHEDGERMVVQDAQGCPPVPDDALYNALRNAPLDAAIVDNRLIASVDGLPDFSFRRIAR